MKTIRPLTALTLMLLSAHATAAVFKCTDAKGKVRYQQQACGGSTTGEKLNLGGSTWVPVHQAPGEEGVTIETQLDVEKIKTLGTVRRAPFRDLTRDANGNRPAAANAPSGIYYHYYDCGQRRISGPVPEAERRSFETQTLGQSNALVTFEDFASGFKLPQARTEIVDRVCSASEGR